MGVTISLSLSQGTPNTTARTTTVSARVTIHYDQGSYDGTQPSGEVTIDGQSFPFVKNFNYAGVGQGAASQSGSTSITITATVPYGTSSSRTVYASASFSRASNSASGSITLTPISSGGSSGGGDDDNTEEWDPDNPGSGSGSGSGSTNRPADAKPGNCEVISQAWLPDYPDGYYSGDTVLIDCRPSFPSADTKYVIIKFRTPNFAGTSSLLTVDPYNFRVPGTTYCSLSYAICTSDENAEKYYNASTFVYDPNQIAWGLLSREELEARPFVIRTNKLKKNTVYYLVLWQATGENCMTWIYMGSSRKLGHGFTVYTNSGIETIDSRGVFDIGNDTYECFLDTGSSWDRLVAAPLRMEGTFAIDSNGSATVDCGFRPDVVVFTGLTYTYNGVKYEPQMSAVFPEKATSNRLYLIASIDNYKYIQAEITQTNTGFELSECGGTPTSGSYGLLINKVFNYTAIKYT